MSSDKIDTKSGDVALPEAWKGHGTPVQELEIDLPMLRCLLAEQHPDLLHLPLRRLDSGWDNLLFRLGDAFVLRFPRRRQAKELIHNEQKWLPILAPSLPLPVPAPVRPGRPGCGYPWSWSVLPWLVGDAADVAPPAGSEAARWAGFLRALHRKAPGDAPYNDFRSGPLLEKSSKLDARWRRLESRLASPNSPLGTAFSASDLDVARGIWEQGVAAPIDLEITWIHGDLHPRNILVDGDEISGVIDWGDVAMGDAATDLASTWLLFAERADREEVLTRYGVSDSTLQRARGWALFFAVVLLDSGLVDEPRHAQIGTRSLERILEGP